MGECLVGGLTKVSKIQDTLAGLGAAGERIANVRDAAAVSHEIPNKYCLS